MNIITKKWAYYNDIDPKNCAWVRELIKAKLITDGEVDNRSIEDVLPSDIAGFRRVHMFCGIAVWDYALRQAGWPDDRPVWTGSCPCQPFSAAGKSGGFDDERHLWPAFHHLISQCRPVTVFGEQVASKDGLAWLDLVQADLEGTGYAVGAVDTCAAGFGAPHIRQRLYWVGHSVRAGLEGHGRRHSVEGGRLGTVRPATSSSEFDGLADSNSAGYGPHMEGRNDKATQRGRQNGTNRIINNCKADGLANASGSTCQWDTGTVFGTQTQGSGKRFINGNLPERLADGGSNDGLANAEGAGEQRESGNPASTGSQGNEGVQEYGKSGSVSGMANDNGSGLQQGFWHDSRDGYGDTAPPTSVDGGELPGPTNGFWRTADWLFCRDNKWRSVASGTFPLVDGAPARVGRLRGYGNAIVAPVAEAFIRAYLDEFEG